MNLGKRTSVLILPVILVSYALAALVIYQQQSQSLSQLESNRLNHRLSELKSEFNAYDSFVDAYLLSLLEGEVLADYIREPSNIYRGKILSSNLESSISRYFGNSREFASLAVLDRHNNLLYYIENSTDPFASAKPEQIELAAKMSENNFLFKWEHLISEKTSTIQQGVSIDSRTLSTPFITDMSHTLQVVVSVIPSKFDRLLKTIAQEYNAKIEFLPALPDVSEAPENNLKGTIQLRKDYYLSISPHAYYIASKLADLKHKLLFIFTLSSLLTFALLQVLIRRFVTGPIEQLDHQLTDVMENKKHQIDFLHDNDEVSRLGRKFYLLHERLKTSLHETHIQSRTDALTQLPNRAAFYDNASKQLSLSEKNQDTLSILYLDLDNFKFVNDKYGHEVGDQLLKAVAMRLKHTVAFSTHSEQSNVELVYRLSGDEFIIMLPAAEKEFILSLGQKILNVFSDGYHFELGHFPVTASIGVSTFPQDGHTLSQLISNADLAMYQAKKSGKNKQALYSQELAKKARNAKEIESRLKEVNCDQEFTLNYMPIINLEGKVKGCEALLRWHSPVLGHISPALFIPIAESTGVFETIDLWVIKRVFQDLPKLKSLLGEEAEISINISSAEFNSERFYSALMDLQQQYKIETRNIILEITETFALEQEDNALDWLQQLREPGYKIAIDDFGTGYTSLMQMVDYPVDIIKFDRQLTERIAVPEKQALAKSLIDLCHLQGMEVVAEGIETIEQHQLLNNVNCNFQQGYMIAKPMTIEDLSSWLSHHQAQIAESETEMG